MKEINQNKTQQIDKEKILNERNEFWKKYTEQELKKMSNDEIYNVFKNEFPKYNDEKTSFYDWNIFSTQLKKYGVEYVSKETQKIETLTNKKLDIIAKADNKVEIFIASQNEPENKFALTDKNGNALMYGKNFYMEDKVNSQETNNSKFANELNVAKTAIYVAKQIKQQKELNDLVLVLKTSNKPLTFQQNSKQKGFVLTEIASDANIGLVVEHTQPYNNPANKILEQKGFMKFAYNSQKDLLEPNDYKNKINELKQQFTEQKTTEYKTEQQEQVKEKQQEQEKGLEIS